MSVWRSNERAISQLAANASKFSSAPTLSRSRAPFEVELLAVARKENAVELVVREAREETAAIELDARQRRIADQHARPPGAPAHAEADLAPVGNLAADVEAALTLRARDTRRCGRVAQLEHAALLEIELRRDEVAARERQRLIELGEELRVLADLQVGEPFAAERFSSVAMKRSAAL